MSDELTIEAVSLRFGGIQALDDVTMSVATGELRALVGPNGAGKSSLFNCVGGLYRPTSGRIVHRGRDITARRPHAIARLGVGRTFQNLAVVDDLSVLDNVALGGHLCARPRGWTLGSTLRLPRTVAAERRLLARAWQLLERFGLLDVARERAAALPFGTLKRVELARALMPEPSLLLVDEPAGGLTQVEVFELGDLLRAICRESGTTVLLVEHHMGLVARIADRVAVLDAGRVIALGRPEEVLQEATVVAAYLGGTP
ncbi:ABC transporter ATP-binding protein [Pimelobacter simplex]|uniref:ABC transporter ATP-binding protein n=1 Tax=Nocardioides simplex TaxID=2045 RepID=UPI003AAB7724